MPLAPHEAAARYQTVALTDARELPGKIDAAIIAAPTTVHADIGCYLLAAGIDVLVEKPIAIDLAAADRLIEAAARAGRILQVGHLERFNPAVLALEQRVTLPLFFEIHRMNLFSPRSLDVDVVLDLMIHDVDLVLGARRGRAGGDPRRGHLDSLGQSGYRQRAPAVPQRLRGQPDRQPHLHRARAQTAPFPAPANTSRWITPARIWPFSA